MGTDGNVAVSRKIVCLIGYLTCLTEIGEEARCLAEVHGSPFCLVCR